MRLKVLDSASEPAAPDRDNEDLSIIGDNLAVILDGSTGLGPQVTPGPESDAVWFVNLVGEHLLRTWNQVPDFPQALKSSVETVATKFGALHSQDKVDTYARPSAALVAVAIEDSEVNVYRMGDCSAVRLTQGTAPIFQESRLEALDRRAIDVLLHHLQSGLSYSDARKATMPMLIKHRAMMNTPDGYELLTVDPSCVDLMEKKTISPVSGERLLLSSDGFSTIFENYGRSDFLKEIALGRQHLKQTITEIRRMENNDKAMSRFPRLKPHDDASAILLELIQDSGRTTG